MFIGYIMSSFRNSRTEVGEASMRVIRATVSLMVVLVPMVFLASFCFAQGLPAGLVVDSSCQIDFLFGQQTFGRQIRSNPEDSLGSVTGDILEALRLDVTPRLPVLDGMIELGSYRNFSLRLRVVSSFLESDSWTKVGKGPAKDEFEARLRPEMRAWEVAGLYHLIWGSPYRFTLVSGYREEYWKFLRQEAGFGGEAMDYRHTSRVPFVGLQTSMSFPLGKAKMEVIGSPFMTKLVTFYAKNSGHFMHVDGTWRDGGMLEVSMDGSMYVSPSVTLGLSLRYCYEELGGEVTGARSYSKSEVWPYDYYTVQNLAYVGFIAGVVF